MQFFVAGMQKNRKPQPQIAVANRTYESIFIEIVRLQKIAVANRVHESLGLLLHSPEEIYEGLAKFVATIRFNSQT